MTIDFACVIILCQKSKLYEINHFIDLSIGKDADEDKEEKLTFNSQTTTTVGARALEGEYLVYDILIHYQCCLEEH